jgi:CelD/BcsL family acetyltransferase involved in cellulose biosynthesis
MTDERLGIPALAGSLTSEWEQLANETGAAPWAWPGWFVAWNRAFAAGESLVYHCARTNGRLRAIGIFRGRAPGTGSAANVHTPWWGILAADREAHAQVMRAALADTPSRLVLRQLREDAEDETTLRAVCREDAFRVLRTAVEQAPFVRVDSDWAAYCRGRISRHLRKEIERCRRRLGEEGPLRYEWRSPAIDELGSLLEEGFRVEASGWKARAGTAILSQPSTTLFYTDVAHWAALHGWLRLGFLRVRGRPVSFELALEKEGVVWLVKGGYDERAARYGPGIVLLHDLLEDAFNRDAREIDLLGSSEPYKLRWANQTRARSSVAAFRRSTVGTADYAAHFAVLRARTAARGLRRTLRER